MRWIDDSRDSLWKSGRRKARTTLLGERMVDQETKRDRSWPFNVSVLSPVIYHRGSIAVSRSSQLRCFFSSSWKYRYACVRSLRRDRKRDHRKSPPRWDGSVISAFPFVLIKTSPNLKPCAPSCLQSSKKERERKRKRDREERKKIKIQRIPSCFSRLLLEFRIIEGEGEKELFAANNAECMKGTLRKWRVRVEMWEGGREGEIGGEQERESRALT